MDATLRSTAAGTTDAAFRRALRAMLERAYDGDFSAEDWDHASGGTHVWLERDGRILAHAALVPRRLVCDGRRLSAGYVEAVATIAPERGRGCASRLMRHVGTLLAEHYEIGALSTGLPDFYARFGWEPWRGPSFVDAPDGRRPTPDDDGGLMVLRTPRTPPLDLLGPLVADWRDGDVW